jgi:hypothetical protein
MELAKISKDLEILSLEEAIEIQGGESLWYWIGYGLGMTGRGYKAQNMPGIK